VLLANVLALLIYIGMKGYQSSGEGLLENLIGVVEVPVPERVG
jgi:hypothetical protein